LLFRFKPLAAVGVGMLVGAVVGIGVVAVGIGAAEAVGIGAVVSTAGVVGIEAAEAISIGVVVITAAVCIEAAEVASMTSKSPNAARIANCSSAAAESTNLMAQSALSLQSVGH